VKGKTSERVTRSAVLFCGACKAGAILGRCEVDGCQATTYSCEHHGRLVTTCGHMHPGEKGVE